MTMIRPRLVLLMGCVGAGKTAWKRCNFDRLPGLIFDLESLAGGFGNPTRLTPRRIAAKILEDGRREAIEGGQPFGIECDADAARHIEAARLAGYRIEGIYIGTESAEINVARNERLALTDPVRHRDPHQVRTAWYESLSRLARLAPEFDRLEFLDNSGDDPPGRPRPVEQCRLEHGRLVSTRNPADLAAWCATWLATHAPENDR